MGTNASSPVRYDLVIVGGGINGVGVAQAAAAQGYSALLLEKTALAAGTSSRSSKLIHGGLRYLENADFQLVRESLHERRDLLRLAPGLVHHRPFYIPVYPHVRRRPWKLFLGLTLYWGLAGFTQAARFSLLRRKHWNQLNGLTTHQLQAVFCYVDAQTDDAQLTQAVMKSAQGLGAELACPAELLDVQLTETGCRIRYKLAGDTHTVDARTLINAAGPWVNRVLKRISPSPKSLDIELVQGAHVTVDHSLGPACFYLEVPEGGRAVFAMPRKDHTLVGTTETLFEGDPDRVEPRDEEIEYLLTVYRQFFPQQSDKVLSAYAGLRVLPKAQGSAFKRSRETRILLDDPARPRVVSIYGGKLTVFRATARKTLALVSACLPEPRPRADLSTLKLEP